MDKLDRDILDELQSHGFQKSAILSSKFGTSDRTIRRRMAIMKKNGIIKIIAVPKPMTSGWRAWAKIGIKVEAGTLIRVAQELIENDSIYFVALSLGKFDIMIAVSLDTIDRLAHFVNSELTSVAGILYTETMVLVSPRKYYDFSWPENAIEPDIGQGYRNKAITNYNSHELDDIDRKIISVLTEDALTPIRVLKTRLGIAESTIRKRVERMLQEEVLKIEVVPNPESMEYEVWATIGLTVNSMSTDKVINNIIQNPAVYLASASLGRFNIVISARFHNIDLLNEFINTEIANTHGIGLTEVFLHTRPIKYHNIKWQMAPHYFNKTKSTNFQPAKLS